MSKKREGKGFSFSQSIGYVVVAVLALVMVVELGGWKAFQELFQVGNGTTNAKVLQSHDRRRVKGFTLPRATVNGSMKNSVENGATGTVGRGALPSAALTPVTWPQARTWASGLKVATPQPTGYDRERYFGTWVNSPSLCGSGTTRDFILKRDLTSVIMDSQCRVKSGVLHDPYTGTVIPFTRGVNTSSLVQIDHVVALQDAWASGARTWAQSRRVAYANDPQVLLASQGEANMAKGNGLDFYANSNPVWLPSYRAYQCDYIAKRVFIKHKYGLTVSRAEKAQTVSLLASCPSK